MGGVPGVVLVLSTVCLYFYSIDDKRAAQIQEQLKDLRYETRAPVQPTSLFHLLEIIHRQ
jgi:Na+/melibiose symporter-like transporter